MSWVDGGSVMLAGPVVATPSAFLATIQTDDGANLFCTSKDLVDWRSPTDPSVFVNNGGHPFYPMGPIHVTKGYAAYSGNPDDARTCQECDAAGEKWYSADGVHWSVGIPDGLEIVTSTAECEADGCLSVPGLALSETIDGSVRTTLYSNDGGSTWKAAKVPSGFGGVYALVKLGNGLFVAAGEDFTVLGGLPSGVTMGDELPQVLVTSKDGVKWTKASRSGSAILAVGNALYLADDTDTWVSTDGCVTWTELPGPGGETVGGTSFGTAGGKIFLTDGYDGTGRILWVGTPRG